MGQCHLSHIGWMCAWWLSFSPSISRAPREPGFDSSSWDPNDQRNTTTLVEVLLRAWFLRIPFLIRRVHSRDVMTIVHECRQALCLAWKVLERGDTSSAELWPLLIEWWSWWGGDGCISHHTIPPSSWSIFMSSDRWVCNGCNSRNWPHSLFGKSKWGRHDGDQLPSMTWFRVSLSRAWLFIGS